MAFAAGRHRDMAAQRRRGAWRLGRRHVAGIGQVIPGKRVRAIQQRLHRPWRELAFDQLGILGRWQRTQPCGDVPHFAIAQMLEHLDRHAKRPVTVMGLALGAATLRGRHRRTDAAAGSGSAPPPCRPAAWFRRTRRRVRPFHGSPCSPHGLRCEILPPDPPRAPLVFRRRQRSTPAQVSALANMPPVRCMRWPGAGALPCRFSRCPKGQRDPRHAAAMLA